MLTPAFHVFSRASFAGGWASKKGGLFGDDAPAPAAAAPAEAAAAPPAEGAAPAAAEGSA